MCDGTLLVEYFGIVGMVGAIAYSYFDTKNFPKNDQFGRFFLSLGMGAFFFITVPFGIFYFTVNPIIKRLSGHRE